MTDYERLINAIVSTLSEHNQRIILRLLRSKQLAGSKPITVHNCMRALKPFFVQFQNVNFDEITAEQIEDWYLQLCKAPSHQTNKPLKSSTIRLTMISVKSLMTEIHGEDVSQKMMKRIKLKPSSWVTVKEEELLTDDEIKRMLNACTSDRDRAIITLLYSSGCRVGELCNLKLHDVTLRRESASLHLNGKTGERDIDIFIGVPELKRWISVHPFRDNPDTYLFTAKIQKGSRFRDSRLREQTVWILLRRLAKRAGIPETKRVNPHSFRHKRATDLADHMTTADLRYMFGWTDMSSTPNIYVHSSRGKVKRKLAEIAGVKIPETVAPSSMIRVCPVCGCINESTAIHCNNCWTPLDEEQARAEQLAREMMAAYVKEMAEKEKQQQLSEQKNK